MAGNNAEGTIANTEAATGSQSGGAGGDAGVAAAAQAAPPAPGATDGDAAAQAAAAEAAQAAAAAAKPNDSLKTTANTPPVPDNSGKPPAPAAWPSDWRKLIAGEDKEVLTQLERLADPKAMFEKVRHLERKLNEKAQPPKRPGKDAPVEDVAAYRKALGIPDKVEDYKVTLPDGLELGAVDQEMFGGFTKLMHENHVPPDVASIATKWYFDQNERLQNALTENDDTFKDTSIKSLRETMGDDFKRNMTAIGLLFEHEGDADLFDTLMGGRTADGNKIGDDPDVLRFLAKVGRTLFPNVSVIPPGGDPKTSILGRLAEIEKLMATDINAYFKNQALQQEYLELTNAKQQMNNTAGRSAA